jgi:hypothetical protein
MHPLGAGLSVVIPGSMLSHRPGMTNVTAHSRGANAPEFCWKSCPLENARAQGMPGARRTGGLVRNGESGCAHEHTGSAEASGIPCVMALRLMPRSPRRRIRLVTVVGGLRDSSTRSGLNCHHRLGTSNGCQDHTVLPYATTSFVLRACTSLTRFNSPCDRRGAPTLSRPPHPIPRS